MSALQRSDISGKAWTVKTCTSARAPPEHQEALVEVAEVRTVWVDPTSYALAFYAFSFLSYRIPVARLCIPVARLRIAVARLRIPVSPYPRIPVSPYPVSPYPRIPVSPYPVSPYPRIPVFRIPVAAVDFRSAPLLDVPTKAKLRPLDKSSTTHSFHSGISLGDTVGTGNPTTVGKMFHTVLDGGIPASVLAGHYHDTYRMGVSNILTSLEHGLRTIDSSIGGLGRCSYSPGATGNVATEDFLCTRRLETERDRGGRDVGFEGAEPHDLERV
ncbi:hypothetical protein OH76DRAFT_1489136 [Lentinus brumalis]|uniref:hydroxymethylglutaryl-CoA lyase n=1 Tax=Lentinus brumalis TaxID=2498619 RepID=A0A371CNL8_9APHY|nr:hypothetical protein OH76DRAFT_1489136 [Polyporus brumalis]